MPLIPDLIDYLLASTLSTGTLGTTNITPSKANQSKGYPAIVVRKIGDAGGHDLAGADGLGNLLLQIDCLANTYAAADSIREGLRNVLDGYKRDYFGSTLTGTYVQACWKEGITDIPYVKQGDDERLHQCSADYRVLFTESIPSF